MKRIRYFDLLRIVCFSFVIYFHMMIQLYINNFYPLEKVSVFYENSNMHLGTLAVAVFFMLSGASLACANKDNTLDIKSFYKKRFSRLLIPFYITYISYFIYKAIIAKSIFNVFPNNTSLWKIVFTLLGIDEWLSMHKIETFSLGIGEWFLGALIVLYALFPLFHKLMHKNKYVFFTIATCVYVYILYNYSSTVPMRMNLLIKGYEFIIGMYLGTYLHNAKQKWMMLSIPTVVFFFTSDTMLNLNQVLKITIIAVAFFVSFSYLENFLNAHKFMIINTLSSCSYELFLVHHVVIYTLTPIIFPFFGGKKGIIILFSIQIFVMVVLTVLLKLISSKILAISKSNRVMF